ncbi:MAG: hypothetical protein LBM61_07845 [Prevotellaceae bacterium]|nr:hypothetical protein [Prevotellaceae bacterium]
MNRSKIRRSTWIALLLLAYVTAMAVYFLPRNQSMSSTDKYISAGASYLIVLGVWLSLRLKEKYRRKHP